MASVGRVFFAIALVAFGVLHLAHGGFVTRVVPWWPAWIPGRALWVLAVGVSLVAGGVLLAAGRYVYTVAVSAGTGLLLSFLLLGVPLASSDAPLGGRWTVAAKALALSGGAWLIARSAHRASTDSSALIAVSRAGPWFFGAFLLLCGVQHFVHAAFVETLVPSWIPAAAFWTRFTGVALIAAGVGVVLPRTARPAGLLTAGMIFVWVLVLHIPRALADVGNTNETTAVFEALAMSGIGLLVAARRLARAS